MIALPKLKQFSTDEEPLFYEESFQLTCSVIHGDSPFAFQWLFQNSTIENTFDIKVENSKKRSILTIDSVSAKHAGEYTCKVLNKAGFSTITTMLVVKGWFYLIKILDFLCFSIPEILAHLHFPTNYSGIYIFVPVLPKLKQFNTDEEPLYYEESFQLFCSVIHGDSPFTFEWLFQNKSIDDFFDIKVENSKKKSGLTIDSVLAKHAGDYTCKVLNKAGFSTFTTTLVVKGWFLNHLCENFVFFGLLFTPFLPL
jgi:hypothetical protein